MHTLSRRAWLQHSHHCALCMQGQEAVPMRFPNGVNRDRFNLITAVLAKHARLKVHMPQVSPSAVTLWAVLFMCAPSLVHCRRVSLLVHHVCHPVSCNCVQQNCMAEHMDSKDFQYAAAYSFATCRPSLVYVVKKHCMTCFYMPMQPLLQCLTESLPHVIACMTSILPQVSTIHCLTCKI